MRKSSLRATVSLALLATLVSAVSAQAQQQTSQEETEVIVLGKRVIRESAGATGLDLSLRQTPQSVTVVSAQQIEEFALSDANQLLATIPGINVEADETDRIYYNSRGFDIINFQVDGVGQPLDWGLQTGALDTAIFDRIEAVRGANGMMTGTGNPSATINYIRKRPTKVFQGALTAGIGSWDNKRLTADLSGPLTASGNLSGRLVYANTDSDSYLDYYGVNRNVYYGVLSWEITPKLNATVGYSQQDNLATGNNWGALPLTYSDGTRIEYDVSATSAAPWTYWDTHDHQTFAELSYAFDNGWTVKGVYTRKSYDDEAKLLYPYGTPDPVTGLGVTAMSGIYPSILKQDLFDVVANGSINLFGRSHQVVMGANKTNSASYKWERFAEMYSYPAIQDWPTSFPAEPVYPSAYLSEQIKTDVTRVYGAIHLNLTDALTGIIGFNSIDLSSDGQSYGTPQEREENKVSPYIGIVYDLNTNVSLYASYSDIFDPQSEADITRRRLDAAQGKSFEAGIKTEWLNRRLYATASVFKTEQFGLAQFSGYAQNDDPSEPGYTTDPLMDGKAYYVPLDTFVEGYELEVAGRITPQWTINGGWTSLKIEDKAGNDVREYLPRQTFKLSSTYAMPQYRDLRLGAAVRWQSDVSTLSAGAVVTQEAYSVVDLTASFRLTDRSRLALNIKNAFDEKYLGGLQWDQAFYAAPRNAMVTLSYDF